MISLTKYYLNTKKETVDLNIYESAISGERIPFLVLTSKITRLLKFVRSRDDVLQAVRLNACNLLFRVVRIIWEIHVKMFHLKKAKIILVCKVFKFAVSNVIFCNVI